MKLLLVGNANTGKTTLFNAITNSKEKASNWSGVTVECKYKNVETEKGTLTVFDLPGINSIEPVTEEERVSVAELKKQVGIGAWVCVVCDAASITKSLRIAEELWQLGIGFDVVVNMVNEVRGDTLKLKLEIEKQFDCKCFLVDARKKKSCLQIKKYYTENLKKNDIAVFANNSKNAGFYMSRIQNIVENCKIEARKMEKLEKLLANKWCVFPLFLVLFVFVFWLAFGPIGSFFSVVVEKVFVDGLLEFVSIKLFSAGRIFGLFFEQVFCVGVGSVICFLPQILILYAGVAIMENSGLVARFSLVFDGFFRRLGMSGRTIFSLLAGFGCTTSAVLVTRNLENKKIRRNSVLALPFFGCSAKLPVLLVVAGLFFEKCRFLCVFCVYLMSFLLFLLVFSIFSLFSKGENRCFFVRLPRLRFPSFRSVFDSVAANFVDFFKRTLFSVVLLCAVLFFLSNFDFSFNLVSDTNGKSVLQILCEIVAPLFSPLGFGSWGVVVALIFGLVAKEMVLSALALVNGVGTGALAVSLVDTFSVVHFSVASAVSFLVFIMLFTPCIPSLRMVAKEIGFWLSCFVGVFQFVVAYVVSMFVYQIGTGNLIFVWILIALVVATCCLFVVKCKRKGDGCYGCYNKNCLRRKSNKAV